MEDPEKGDILSKKCCCQAGTYQICRHMVAVLMHLRENIAEITAKTRYEEPAEKSVLRELGLRADFFKKEAETSDILFSFTRFNIGIKDLEEEAPDESLLARDLKFGIKVFDGRTRKKGVVVDRELIKGSKGQNTFFLDYIACNGTYVQGEYQIGQYNIDTAFSIASGLEGVYWSDPPKKIEITNEFYKPKLRMAASADGSMLLSDENKVLLIPRKYSVFVLVDDKVMKLSPKVTYSFVKNTQKHLLFDPDKAFVLENMILPSLRRLVDLKNDGIMSESKTEIEDIKPEVSIYIMFDKETELIYLLPRIDYVGYYSVNPFQPEYINS